jgi:hypothetical protein
MRWRGFPGNLVEAKRAGTMMEQRMRNQADGLAGRKRTEEEWPPQ